MMLTSMRPKHRPSFLLALSILAFNRVVPVELTSTKDRCDDCGCPFYKGLVRHYVTCKHHADWCATKHAARDGGSNGKA
jgi:hypothetical protein